MARPTRTPKRRVKKSSSGSAKPRGRPKRGKNWEEKLSPQQKAALTRARRAFVRAKPSEVDARREAFVRTLERAGAPPRSRSARVGGASRERAQLAEERRRERERQQRRRRERERREREEAKRRERERRERARTGWVGRLSPQRRTAIERLRRAFEEAPPEATIQARLQGLYAIAREAYVRALQRADAPPTVIRALVAAVIRRRRRPTQIRQEVLAPMRLDARTSRNDWRTLQLMVDENDERFRQFMAEMLVEDYNERQGRDAWFSPEAW